MEVGGKLHPDRSMMQNSGNDETTYDEDQGCNDTRASSFTTAANAMFARFEEGDEDGNLDEVISLHRQALKLLPPPNPNSPVALNNLADALQIRFWEDGQQADLDEAISLNREALELRPFPHPRRAYSLNRLANSLNIRFGNEGRQVDLDEDISLSREALELEPLPHPGRDLSLSTLGSALLNRYNRGGQQTDLEEAISLHRQALKLQIPSHPDRLSYLNNLGNAVLTRFEQTGGRHEDLEEAILLYRTAHGLQPSDPDDQSQCFNNLGNALIIRFEQGGQTKDLTEAISLHRGAVELVPSPNPNRFMSLDNLGTALATRFEQEGRQGDLDEAISLHREASELLDSSHPDRSRILGNLANSLQNRFHQLHQEKDLTESVSLHRQALELLDRLHPDRSTCLCNLATTLCNAFRQGGRPTLADLDESISLHREALKLRPPPHCDRSTSLNNLATSILTRFQQGGQGLDLDEAISLQRESLALQTPSHPTRAMYLNNLGGSLKIRSELRGQEVDLREAISLHREALQLQPLSHPDRASSLFELGKLFIHAHSAAAGNSGNLEEAMSSFRAATKCPSQPPQLRLTVARTWIRHADKYQHISAIDAYEAALETLSQVAALSFDLQSRQEALSFGSDGLARDASRCAIKAGHLDKAIELLEAGRGVFWSQILSLRSPFLRLHDIKPDLSNKIRATSTALELGSHQNTSVGASKLSLDREASRRNRLHEELQKYIDEARELQGFEDFLRPSPLSSLKSAASKYPIIVLLANDDSSHCLVMTSATIHHIPLPTLHTGMLQKLTRLIQAAVSHLPISRSFIKETRENIIEFLEKDLRTRMPQRVRHLEDSLESSDDIFRYVLRILWDEIVKPVIEFLNIHKSGEMPVLQWCPTGLFTFLPIHAAGFYGDDRAIECAADYFISSYTPTIGALLTQSPIRSVRGFRMMVIVQSADLPAAKKESENIQLHVPKEALLEFGVSGKSAKVEEIASRLSGASIVHLVCHGVQDRLKPLDSGLKLDDGILRLSRIVKERKLNRSLAFLCACETAMGDQSIPDEAMSLGASFLFSGFRRVIATMWQMRDEDGPAIVDTFYEELFRGPDGKIVLEPDTTRSAHALHIAVAKLRSQNVSFRRWVPFIHMGNCMNLKRQQVIPRKPSFSRKRKWDDPTPR